MTNSERRAVLLQACAAVCPGCEKKRPMVTSEAGVLLHEFDGPAGSTYGMCKAQPIRALLPAGQADDTKGGEA